MLRLMMLLAWMLWKLKEHFSIQKIIRSRLKNLEKDPMEKFLLFNEKVTMFFTAKVHRDLKPENILVDENFNPHVCDFGQSKYFPESFSNSVKLILSGVAGTPLCMVPEFLNDDNIYDPSIDVYAFAIMAFEICTGKQPFLENGRPISIISILNKVKSGDRPKFDEGFPTKMEALISRCWSQLPSDRPTFKQIFEELSSVTQFTDYMEEAVDEDAFRSSNTRQIARRIRVLRADCKVA